MDKIQWQVISMCLSTGCTLKELRDWAIDKGKGNIILAIHGLLYDPQVHGIAPGWPISER